jgi:2-(1,2-epoxy-1,2-dihydrophenyl)acetyl-CoA isomerase
LSSYKTLLFDLSDNVATITLNRPDRLNALTPELLGELRDALEKTTSGGARALILTGADRAFCAGADMLDRSLGDAGTDGAGQLLKSHYHPVVLALADLQIPVITAINGPAVGAGLSLALAGDIILAARSSYLLLAFANIGLVPDAGATWLVAKAIGRTKALEMALLGERVPAETAEQIGLVTRVIDDQELMAEARAIAGKLAGRPTVALGLIRQQFRTGLTGTLEETLEIEQRNQTLAGRTHDFREAVKAFAEKRPPVFKGN